MSEVPYGFCHCGCGNRTTVSPQTNRQQGYVKDVPRPWLPGHHCRKTPMPLELYLVDSETGCWVWQLARNNGYGAYKSNRAHRVIYERHRGPIPDGLELDHTCRNRACVNPDHLEPVTRTVNQRRGLSTKLTEETVRYIKRSLGTRPQGEIAREVGISQGVISQIKHGHLWIDVAAEPQHGRGTLAQTDGPIDSQPIGQNGGAA